MEAHPYFPIVEYLAVFYKYTFKQTEIESYCVCLATWHLFLDHLISERSSSELTVGRSVLSLHVYSYSSCQKILSHYTNYVEQYCLFYFHNQ